MDAAHAGAALLRAAHVVSAHRLPDLVRRYARELGAVDAVAYLVDLQQTTLQPFPPAGGPLPSRHVEPLAVDGTLAGRAFAHVDVLTQPGEGGRQLTWVPLLNGSERLGVLQVSVDPSDGGTQTPDRRGLEDFAAVVAELVMTKTMYGDTIVRLRRSAEMGLAAELQWSLLPPLTFTAEDVSVAAALEPAYEVAGDTVDYAVDAGRARAAILDGMGHGLRSSMLAAVATAAYRSARRAGQSLTGSAVAIDDALSTGFGGAAFTTGVLADLDTETGRLEWVSAGHPAPLLLRGGKLVRALQTPPALPFGLRVHGVARPPLTIGTEDLEPDDVVVLYSDGVVEARSPEREFFGEQRLVDLVVRSLAAGLPTSETLRRLVRALLEHQQGQLTDDASLLLLRWRSSAD